MGLSPCKKGVFIVRSRYSMNAQPDILPALIGQQQVVTALAQTAKRRNSYGHAYLLSGADAVAVVGVAEWFRNFLVCSAPVGETPCDACPGCRSRQRADGLWSQTLRLTPEQPVHSVETIRRIRQFTTLRPVAEGQRVVMLEGADTLAAPAANALLKVLEEPGERLTFILTAHSLAAVRSTVRSRAMTVAIQPVPTADLTAALVRAGHTRNAAAFAVGLYPGQAGRAFALLAEEARVAELRQLDHTLADWDTVPRAQRLAIAADLLHGITESSDQRQRLRDILSVLATHAPRRPRALRALLEGCSTLRTNAQPKLIFDAFSLTAA